MEPFQPVWERHALHLRDWEERFPNLVAGFTLRTGGTSSHPFSTLNLGLHVGDNPAVVVANRRRVADRLGVSFTGWTSAEQVHGTKVCQVNRDMIGAGNAGTDDAIPGTDGMHTDLAGVLLTSFYADCVPLYFLAPRHRAIGLAHAGWKGTVGRIAAEMVRSFREAYGTKPEELYVAVGPSIGSCCYEVDDRVIDRVKTCCHAWESSANPGKSGRYMLDLGRLNEQILLECGVLPDRINRSGWCTACRTDLFFSYRKENGTTGRMASFIAWKQEGDPDENIDHPRKNRS